MGEAHKAIREHIIEELLQGLVLLTSSRIVAHACRDLNVFVVRIQLVDADLRRSLGLAQLLDVAVTLRDALLYVSLIARSRLHERGKRLQATLQHCVLVDAVLVLLKLPGAALLLGVAIVEFTEAAVVIHTAILNKRSLIFIA